MAKKRKQSKKAKQGGGGGKAWLLLLLFLLAGVGGYLYTRPSQVAVPSLAGKSEKEARAALDSLSLNVEIQLQKPENPEVVKGTVLGQAPAAGTQVPKGSVVTLFLADVEAGIEIPGVVGKTRSEAEDILRRVGFEVQFTEAQSEAVEIGRVISQTPVASSRLEKGQTVTLTISGGRGEQGVPDLRELPLDIARRQLKEAGLELVVLQVAQSGFREGDPVKVLRQEPDPGTKLPVGSRVTVFIPIPAPTYNPASGTGGQAVRHAPRLEGLTVAQAREFADSEGVVLEFAESAEDSSVITFQEPPPGDPLPAGSKAVLVRTASSSVVPGLTGLSESQARKRVEEAGLTVGSVKHTFGPVPGEVMGQRPSAGIEVLAGSQVDLVVADPKMAPDSANSPPPSPTPAFTPAPWVE